MINLTTPDYSNYSQRFYENLTHLNYFLRYVTGGNPLDKRGEATTHKPLLLDLGRVLNYVVGKKEDSLEYQSFFSGDKATCEGMLSVMFQIEMFKQLNLMMLSGEYLHFLRMPDNSSSNITGTTPFSGGYLGWLEDYVSALTSVADDREQLINALDQPGKKSRVEIKFFKPIQTRYFNFKTRHQIFGSFIEEYLPEFLASIDAHYHFTQAESKVTMVATRDYLSRFREYEYPLHLLFNLLLLNIRVAKEDHFLSADHTALARLINFREQVRRLMRVKKDAPPNGDTSNHDRDLLPTQYTFIGLFDELGEEDPLGIFGPTSTSYADRFYSKLDLLIIEKFEPVVQALYEKINFLIRKLLLRHGYRTIKDPRMMQLDDQRIPLVFMNRGLVKFSYEDYQLSYNLFKWEQRAKYNYTDTQTFAELQGFQINQYRTKLNTPIGKCNSSKLPSINTYHYATRYFRDFEPSSDYLYKLYDSFRQHIYDTMATVRTQTLTDHSEPEAFRIKGFLGKSQNVTDTSDAYDALNEHNWSAAKHMVNYLYYSYLSLRLSGKFDHHPEPEEARKLMSEVRLLQEETGIYSYFPYYKYARYLLKQIDLRLDEGNNQDVEQLYIQLRETITTCDHYFLLCKKNEFIPLHLPIAECFPYEQPSEPSYKPELPKERIYEFVVNGVRHEWKLDHKSVRMFVSSSYVLPISYEIMARRIDELKGEVEGVALRQVTVLSEKNRNESKALKEDLFKIFGWFTGIVSFIVGGLFKMISGHSGGVYDGMLFMASFGLCLMLFLFALFGLIKGKSAFWDRLFIFLQAKADFNVDGARQTTFTKIARVTMWTLWRYCVGTMTALHEKVILGLRFPLEPAPDNAEKQPDSNKSDSSAPSIQSVKRPFLYRLKRGSILFCASLGWVVLTIIGLVALLLRWFWTAGRYTLVLLVRVFHYISAGGVLWRSIFFVGAFSVLLWLYLERDEIETSMLQDYQDTLVNAAYLKVVDSLQGP